MAVAFNSFDTLLAPFVKKDQLKYNEVKQAMQNFIFSINSNSRGGAEPAFSNITLDITPPDDLLNEQAIIGSGFADFTYKDCQAEMDMINKAFCELMIKGDARGRPFAYPIPTYNIHKRFDWDNPNNKLLWEMTGKYGYPYFANFLNSDMEPSDARSMALCGTQKIIIKNKDGKVITEEIQKVVTQWLCNKTAGLQVLMNGEFVDIIDMFKVPYEKYDNYVSIQLDNGYIQPFSEQHKCLILNGEETQVRESQQLQEGDNFLVSSKPWGIDNHIGTYQGGLIAGYYLSDGHKVNNAEIRFVLGSNERDDTAEFLKMFFGDIGCNVSVVDNEVKGVWEAVVHGEPAVSFVERFVSGDKLVLKRLSDELWNASDDFRRGVFDGYLNTNGFVKNGLLAHTTNKGLIDDLVVLASSLGHILIYKENKMSLRSDNAVGVKRELTCYKLRLADTFYKKRGDYYIVPIKSVSLLPSESTVMYNFTVDTPEHLFELPNGIITHQCCRLRLDLSELKRRNGGLFGSGDSTGCYDDQTEVLTDNRGWILFKDLSTDDILLTRNKDGDIEKHKPKQIFKYPYNGKLYHFENSAFDMMVTPNHNMVYRDRQTNKQGFVRADQYSQAKHPIPRTATYLEADKEHFELPDTIYRDKDRGENARIPREILNECSKRQLNILLDAIRLESKNGGDVYYTKSKAFANDFQELCLKCGLAAEIKELTDEIIPEEIDAFTGYRISIVSGDDICIGDNDIKQVEYDGFVFCCEVENHTLMVRRNGKATWCGNSIGVCTINLPLIAYESNGDADTFYAELDRILNIAKDSLEIKRAWLQKNVMDTRLIPAFCYYVGTLRNHFNTIGIIGMNEMCENFFADNSNILTEKGKQFAIDVGQHIRSKLIDFQRETGNLYNFEATPAESTAFRLAKKDREKHPDIITRGTAEAPYYTNSCHIPVDSITSIRSTFYHQDDLQTMFTGGTVIHIYTNTAISGEAAKDIISTVCKQYKAPYVSISPLSRFCPEHGYIADEVDECPLCGGRIQKYQRITGYMRCVDDFNDGKKSEFEDRVQLNIKY